MTPALRPSMPVPEALRRAAACLSQPAAEFTEPLSCGVDLGTATCVLAVVDSRGFPVYVDQMPSRALRDGVIVDFHGAAATVSMQALKGRASYLGPRSVGHEDPGAASTALILAALRDAARAGR